MWRSSVTGWDSASDTTTSLSSRFNLQTSQPLYLTTFCFQQGLLQVTSSYQNISLKVLYNANVMFESFAKLFKVLSSAADDQWIQMLYRNALDVHCKHTASHLHDEVNVPQGDQNLFDAGMTWFKRRSNIIIIIIITKILLTCHDVFWSDLQHIVSV